MLARWFQKHRGKISPVCYRDPKEQEKNQAALLEAAPAAKVIYIGQLIAAVEKETGSCSGQRWCRR